LFYVSVLGFRFEGLGIGICGLGFRFEGSGFGVQSLGFRIQDLGFRVQDLGFRVLVEGGKERGELTSRWRTSTNNVPGGPS